MKKRLALTAFIVVPADKGNGLAEVFFYDTETARDAVLEHGQPGRFAVLEAFIFEVELKHHAPDGDDVTG